MSATKYFFIVFSIMIIGAVLFLFKSIPPAILFNRNLSSSTPSLATVSPTPQIQPENYPLPSPKKISSVWYSQSIPEKNLQFHYPESWGTPSASLTTFPPPNSGSLMGIYFLFHDQEDTPIFIEITSPDFHHTASTSALFSESKGNLTNTIIKEDDQLYYYTYANLPQAKVYVYLPDIQNQLPETQLENYFKTTSTQIFNQSGLSSDSMARLKTFLEVVKSIQPLTK